MLELIEYYHSSVWACTSPFSSFLVRPSSFIDPIRSSLYTSVSISPRRFAVAASCFEGVSTVRNKVCRRFADAYSVQKMLSLFFSPSATFPSRKRGRGLCSFFVCSETLQSERFSVRSAWCVVVVLKLVLIESGSALAWCSQKPSKVKVEHLWLIV